MVKLLILNIVLSLNKALNYSFHLNQITSFINAINTPPVKENSRITVKR